MRNTGNWPRRARPGRRGRGRSRAVAPTRARSRRRRSRAPPRRPASRLANSRLEPDLLGRDRAVAGKELGRPARVSCCGWSVNAGIEVGSKTCKTTISSPAARARLIIRSGASVVEREPSSGTRTRQSRPDARRSRARRRPASAESLLAPRRSIRWAGMGSAGAPQHDRCDVVRLDLAQEPRARLPSPTRRETPVRAAALPASSPPFVLTWTASTSAPSTPARAVANSITGAHAPSRQARPGLSSRTSFHCSSGSPSTLTPSCRMRTLPRRPLKRTRSSSSSQPSGSRGSTVSVSPLGRSPAKPNASACQTPPIVARWRPPAVVPVRSSRSIAAAIRSSCDRPAEATRPGQQRCVHRRGERASVGGSRLVELEVRAQRARRDLVRDKVVKHEDVRLLHEPGRRATRSWPSRRSAAIGRRGARSAITSGSRSKKPANCS